MDGCPPLRLHTLPVDILIDILKTLPNFPSVIPLLLTHRAFNEVWLANFPDISQTIAHHAFTPFQDAVNLMLEQLHPLDDVMPLSELTTRLTKADIAQLHSNALYCAKLELKHDRIKEEWNGPPLADSPSELLRFRRAVYRVWLYMMTIDLPKCELMCTGLPLTELVEMQNVAKHFDSRTSWPGLPDFSVFPPGSATQSLEGVMRRRITDYCRCDVELELDEVYDLKRHYWSLNLEDQSVRGREFCRKVERLNEIDKNWRKKRAEEEEKKE